MATHLETADGNERRRSAAGALQFALFLIGAVAVVCFFRLRDPGIPDPDSFYHFRHAALYAEKGLLLKPFPWLAYSIISRFSSDIGYGFHLLLIPFTFLRDPVLGARLAAVFEAIAVLVMVYAVARRHRMRYAAAWPFMLFFLGPPIPYTFAMTRPQTLTMGFAALLLSYLVKGSPWGVLLSSLALSFFHLNISPIIPAIVLVAGVVKGLNEKAWEWRKWLAALLGIVVGWLARPNPLGTAKLEYVQVLVHAVVRQKRIPLLFGREWLPITANDAISLFGYFLAIWVVLMVVFVAAAVRKHDRRVGCGAERRAVVREDQGEAGDKPGPAEGTLLWSSFLLSLAFFAVTVLNTKRATPLWAVFAVIFAAQAFTSFVAVHRTRAREFPSRDTRLVLSLLMAVLFALMVWEVVNQQMLQGRWMSGNAYRMRAASEWVRDHGRPGEIVFNVDWGMFPELFFWNARSYYVSGLDPLFLYAYDQRLYWKAHHLAVGDGTAYTWPTEQPQLQGGEDTYTVLRRDFRASYVALQTRQTPALQQYLESDRGFVRRFDDGQIAVYELLPLPGRTAAVAHR